MHTTSWRTPLAALVGAAVVAAGAHGSVPVPGSPVPQSAQTLAVVLVGAFLGPRLGAASLLLYLALGAAGAPVFADGASGVARLWGPTGGYLVGFVVGAAMVGWGVVRRGIRRWAAVAGLMLAAHACILLLGWARLALSLGAADADLEGVHPFFVGALVKSALGAAAVVGWWRVRGGGTPSVPA